MCFQAPSYNFYQGNAEEVTVVPKIGCRRPLQSQTGHVHCSVHQQEENGHNAGDVVELPCEQHQLERKKEENTKQGEKEMKIREKIKNK